MKCKTLMDSMDNLPKVDERQLRLPRLFQSFYQLRQQLAVGAFLMVSLILPARAGDEAKTMVPEEIAAPEEAGTGHDWSLELGSGAQWSNVRARREDSYTMVPGVFTAALKLDDISLDNYEGGWLRGYSEFLFQGYGYALTRSPNGESRIFGANVGPRYNFVQPGWKFVPYVQGLVGLGIADANPGFNSSGRADGLGQDFNFSFGVGFGVRYDISERWFVRLGAEYTHFSNADLSEPEHANRPIDALGPMLSVGFRP